MKNLKWIFFVIKLFIRYGPALVEVGIEIYKRIEEFAKEKKIQSSEKARRFDVLAKIALESQNNNKKTNDFIKNYRQDIWSYMNPTKAFV